MSVRPPGLRTAVRVLTLALAVAGAAAVPSRAEKLDDGRLDPSWFGSIGELRKSEEIDYLWVDPGFSVAGHTIRVAPWEDPTFLGEKRDSKDHAKAEELTERMPSLLKGSLGATLGDGRVSKEKGDLVLSGRFVDVSAGSKAAKWLVGMGAGSAFATFDIKITQGGKTVAAIHHRVISGTVMSEVEDKIVKWLDEFGKELEGNLAVYAKAKKAKD